MDDYNLKFEENLLAVQKEKEESDRRMLKLEMVIGIISSVAFLVLIFTASFADLYPIARVALISIGALIFIIGVANAIKIEQIAGYYECRECNHKYVPSYNSVLFSIHHSANDILFLAPDFPLLHFGHPVPFILLYAVASHSCPLEHLHQIFSL